uniref:Trafficking protein particle complex subunit n=1 Tax=Syphacia muris TaxID=451379 RepID=A0A0N5ATW2_9BILA
MSIYKIFIINRGGSLIYDWEGKNDAVSVEKTFSYPIDIVLEVIDQRVTVVFGERDGIGLRYTLVAVNGFRVQNSSVTLEDGKAYEVLEYLKDEAHFPLNLRFAPPAITPNEKIILSSTFHSLFTIAAQLSPVSKSSGIEVLSTSQFRLHCFQSTTGVKFVIVGVANVSTGIEGLLRKIYELYADYALKNPFYSIDMPIRCQRFDDAIKNLIEKHDKINLVTI